MDDEAAMRAAVRRAAAGLGATYPNPCVGAALVARGKLIATARSDPTGGPHAEVKALSAAGKKARGATLYVTLEPCCHVGRTGRCTDAIVEAGIDRVVVGVRDPADHVAGQGIRRLRRAGVTVEVGVGGQACERLHEHYLHHERTGLPFVTLKAATSIDGRIATAGGDSKWITSEASRRHGHRLRAQHHAIGVGLQTVLADDPQLSVRMVRGVDPIPVVFDTKLTLAEHLERTIVREGTWILHGSKTAKKRRAALRERGVTLIESKVDAGHLDLAAALTTLGRRQIRSILIEGGGHLLGSFVAANLWQRLYVFQAPVLLGEGRSMIAGIDWPTVEAAARLTLEKRQKLGEDLLSIYRPRSST